MSPKPNSTSGVVVGVFTITVIPSAPDALMPVTVPVPVTACQYVFAPSVVSTYPSLATWSGNRLFSASLAVVALVPPCSIASVPSSVITPAPVTGPPNVVNPVVPPDTPTLVTLPVPVEAISMCAMRITRPLESTVMCGTLVGVPYVPGTTPTSLSVVSKRPIPLPVTSPVRVIV